MRRNLSAAAALSALFLSWPAHAQTFQAGQTWINDRGSELTISSIDADGSFKGTYVNRAAGFDCKDQPYAATGWIENDLIGFQVRWVRAGGPNCNSITSWTGFYTSNLVMTHWDLSYTDARLKQPTIYRGTDFFRKK